MQHPKIKFYDFTCLTLTILLLICCLFNIFKKSEVYGIDFTINDTKSVPELEPVFLKSLEDDLDDLLLPS